MDTKKETQKRSFGCGCGGAAKPAMPAKPSEKKRTEPKKDLGE